MKYPFIIFYRSNSNAAYDKFFFDNTCNISLHSDYRTEWDMMQYQMKRLQANTTIGILVHNDHRVLHQMRQQMERYQVLSKRKYKTF